MLSFKNRHRVISIPIANSIALRLWDVFWRHRKRMLKKKPQHPSIDLMGVWISTPHASILENEKPLHLAKVSNPGGA